MAFPNYRSQFGDTTFTKVFVGGLAWETPTDEMRHYFEQFGDILEAVIIADKNTGKSKGYGFVTFRDPESARRACANPNPVIDGRRANCNIASLGRPRPSPPRGRSQGGSPFQGAGSPQGGVVPNYSGSVPAPLPPPPPPVLYNPYGYPTYTPADYGYHQAVYNTPMQQPQYYHQMYGTSPSSSMINNAPTNYYYGYSFQAPTPPRAASFSTVPTPPPPPPHHQRNMAGPPPPPPSYLYFPNPYSSNVDPTVRFSSPYQASHQTHSATTTTTHHFPSPTDSQSQQHPSRETEAGVSASESPNT